jgi:LPS-assembly lipoprotein
MSSLDRSRRLLLAGLATTLLLAGCQARPLYSGGNATSDGPAIGALKQIAVETQRGRTAQVLMNELIFVLRGGAELVNPRYKLDLIVSTRSSELAIQRREEVPTANLIALTATYTLTETTSGRVITSDTIYTTASYDFQSQRFANLRAQRDAEDRAAKAAATDIRLRLATILADGA